MPLVKIDNLPDYRQAETPEQDYTAGDIIKAAFVEGNDLYGIYRGVTDPKPDVTEQEFSNYSTGLFDPFESIKDTRYDIESRKHLYADLQSQSQVEWMNGRLDEEDAANNVLQASPWYQTIIPSAVSYGLSPTSVFLPGKVPLTALKGATKFGLKTAAVTASQEVALHSQQFTRTPEQSAMGVVLPTVFGGTVGAFAGRARARKNVINMENDFVGPLPQHQASTQTRSMGAAEVSQDISMAERQSIMDDPTLNPDQKIIKTFEAEARPHTPVKRTAIKSAGLGFWHKAIPEQRVMLSDSPVMRKWGDNVLNHPLMVEDNMVGRGAIPLEEIAALPVKKMRYEIPEIFKAGYESYAGGFIKRAREKLSPTEPKMSRLEFNQRVQVAMTRNGADEIKEIAQTARTLMDKYTLPAKERLLKNHMLEDAPPMGDETWFPRAYSRGFAEVTPAKQYADELMPGIVKRLELRAAEGDKKAIKALTPEGLAKEHERLMAMRTSIAHGSDSAGGSYSGSGVLKDADGILQPVKARTLDVSTTDIPADFLDSNVVDNLVKELSRLERQLAAYEDVRIGDPSFLPWRTDRLAEYEASLNELVRNKATLKERQALKKALNKDLEDINGLAYRYNGMRQGTTSDFVQNITSTILMFHSVTKLGRVILSQIPEIMANAATVGIDGVVRHAVDKLVSPRAMRGISKQVRADMAAGLESASSYRFIEQGMYDATSPQWTRWMNKGADFIVDKAYGMGYWTRFSRRQSAMMIQSKIGRLMLKKHLSKINKQELSRMGITEDIIPSLRKEVRSNYKKLTAGTVDMNMGAWENRSLFDHINTAIAADSKMYQLDPGIGSIPFLGDTVHGALLLQFKTFTLMATSRYHMAGVQRTAMGDTKAMQQMASMTALAAVGQVLRTMSYGKEPDYTPSVLLREGLIRGGWFGATGNLNAFAEQLTGGDVSAFRLLGMKPRTPSNYWATKTMQGELTGPSGQLLIDGLNITTGLYNMIINGEVNRAQLSSMRRSVPGQNYLITAPYFNTWEKDLYTTFGK